MTRPSSPRLVSDIATPSPTKHPSSTSSSKKLVSRSNSTRNRGINLNLAVSPLSVASSPAPKKSSLPQVTETSVPGSPSGPEDLKFDVPLPPMDHLLTLNIDDQLRLLALKEMSVVEIKDGINTLTQKLNNTEKDLHKLREVIQKSLYKELSQGSSAKPTSNPREEAIASTRIGARRRTLSSSSHNVPQISTTEAVTSPKNDKRLSALWSNLSKPLNMIQQFDTMLQNEFEKSLLPDSTASSTANTSQKNRNDNTRQYHARKLSLGSTSRARHSEDSISSSSSSAPSPLKSRESNSKIDLDHFFPHSESAYRTKNQDDMLQSVSSSIWSFVNDVKSNMLSSLGEEAEEKRKFKEPIYNLENGSTISVEDSQDNTLKVVNSRESVEQEAEEDIDLTMYSLIRRKELTKND